MDELSDPSGGPPEWWPGPSIPPPPAPPEARSGRRLVGAVITALAVLVAGVGIWGFAYHPGYDQFLPGDALAVSPLISVHGARSYRPKGDVFLLFVRERSNLNEWQYLWAKAFGGDDDITPHPPPSPANSTQQDVCDMTDSQATAKLVALRKLGYKVTTQPGVVIQEVGGGIPASNVLRCDDVIRSVDGQRTDTLDALHVAITKHKPGEVIDVGFDRGNQHFTRGVKLVRDPQTGATIVGVIVSARYVYPLGLSIDTADIGGPSAGLAMTLALLDQLTAGDLTGGKRVAVTGTINPDGTVGEIGEIRLKAIAARRRGVQLFIVPACTDPDAASLNACKRDLVAAERVAKGVKVVPVRTLDDALRALVANGGDPLPKVRPPQ